MPCDWKCEAREVSSGLDLVVHDHRVQVCQIQGKDWRY